MKSVAKRVRDVRLERSTTLPVVAQAPSPVLMDLEVLLPICPALEGCSNQTLLRTSYIMAPICVSLGSSHQKRAAPAGVRRSAEQQKGTGSMLVLIEVQSLLQAEKLLDGLLADPVCCRRKRGDAAWRRSVREVLQTTSAKERAAALDQRYKGSGRAIDQRRRKAHVGRRRP